VTWWRSETVTNPHPGATWTSASAIPHAAATAVAAAYATRPRVVAVAAWPCQTSSAAATTARTTRASTHVRGSPVSPTSPRTTAIPIVGGAARRTTDRHDEDVAAVGSTRRASTSWPSTSHGRSDWPWTTPMWTSWPTMAPLNA